jgi:DNA-binding response OmpR family regulator/predicted Ser/Thr protein kinase
MNDKKNILFINRDKNFLKENAEHLSRRGYAVKTAMDMREVLSTLSATVVDLILCDNKLKDVNGYDLLRFLKNDPLREKIPFVFCVPLHDQGSAKKAFEDGATDFMVYPLDPDEIASRVGEICSPSENGGRETAAPPDPEMNFSATQMVKSIPDQDTEKREDKRAALLRILKVEISRNGILWIPGQIKNISSKGMFLKTSMLGKAGVELYVRVSLPSGAAVVKGSIKHIAFKNIKASEDAGIGVEIEKSAEWQEYLKYIKSHLQKGNGGAVPPKPVEPPPARNAEHTIMITRGDDGKNEVDTSQKSKGSSFEERFYNSLIGKQFNNYKVVSLIGSGAMGGVFEGWDIALERAVALKVISFELSAQEKFREMFIKEARFISQLDNPNIASIYHIGNENQILYFAMEFIEGSSMAELIRNEVKLNTMKGLDYFLTICEALEFMSHKNIIHRDLKPANIMINKQGVVKLVDFGVAATVDVDEKIKEGIVGSPYYISPDSINGLPLDQRSDIYSLGASFYHAFTGFLPFEGD